MSLLLAQCPKVVKIKQTTVRTHPAWNVKQGPAPSTTSTSDVTCTQFAHSALRAQICILQQQNQFPVSRSRLWWSYGEWDKVFHHSELLTTVTFINMVGPALANGFTVFNDSHSFDDILVMTNIDSESISAKMWCLSPSNSDGTTMLCDSCGFVDFCGLVNEEQTGLFSSWPMLTTPGSAKG
jgi:hypothetical protein